MLICMAWHRHLASRYGARRFFSFSFLLCHHCFCSFFGGFHRSSRSNRARIILYQDGTGDNRFMDDILRLAGAIRLHTTLTTTTTSSHQKELGIQYDTAIIQGNPPSGGKHSLGSLTRHGDKTSAERSLWKRNENNPGNQKSTSGTNRFANPWGERRRGGGHINNTFLKRDQSSIWFFLFFDDHPRRTERI